MSEADPETRMNRKAHEAFPSCLSATVSRLSPIFFAHACPGPGEPFPVLCSGAKLFIPYRILDPEPSESVISALDPIEQVIVACWFTRHHNGYVRERFLRALTSFESDWVIAYVVVLTGEYIIEILQYIWDHRQLFDRRALGRLLRDNQQLYALTKKRIVSYWDCYFRSSLAPAFDNYVGFHILAFFDACTTTST
jgi:hypothetical protein